MAMYPDAMHTDALAAQSGGFHAIAYDAQQRNIHGDCSMTRVDQGYGPAEAMMENANYMTPNGYYVPPQAPRLMAAAARASSMAAMYYNPTLHPLHPLNSNVEALDPWTSTYRANEYGQHSMRAPTYHHQQVEHQLMAQNKRGYGNLAGYSAAATAYGHEQHQPEQQYAHRYSYPHDRSQRAWTLAQHPPIPAPPPSAWTWIEGQDDHGMSASYQRNCSDATPTGHTLDQDGRGQSYFDYSKQIHQPPTTSHSHSLSLPDSAHMQNGKNNWDSTQGGNGWDSRESTWPQGYANKTFQDAWQGQRSYNQGNDASLWNRGHAEAPSLGPDGWVQPLQYSSVPMATQYQTSMGPSIAYQPQCNAYSDTQNTHAAPQDQNERSNESRAKDGKEQVVATEQAKSAPAPPSPDTLDKSAVPISSVGAEIIWSACVVFTEPEMLASCTRHQKQDVRLARGRTPSNISTSSSKYSPHWVEADWSKQPTLQNGHERNQRGSPKSQFVQRMTVKTAGEATTSSEESSASSSEPGTPPSSFPLYMYPDAPGSDSKQGDKRKSYDPKHDIRGLGLPDSESHFTRDCSMPPLERRRTQDGVQEAVSSVLNLIPLDCRWSLHEDKFLSLSQSLREAAKVDSPSPRNGSMSCNRMSPRSEDIHSINGAAAQGSEPSPAFRRFAHQVLAQTLVSPTAFILAMMYSLRVPYLAIQVNSDGVEELDAEAREIFAQPPSAAPFKLFTLGLMIANKHLDDNTFLNKTWNEVTGISLTEINRMERWYLEKCSYEIAVPEEPWVAFLESLALRTESKLSTSSDTRRHRINTKSRSSMSHSNSHAINTFKTLGGLTHEEALKRMLLSVEEALVVVGRLAPFDLTRQIRSASPSFGSDHRRFASASPSTIATSKSGNSLQSLHHDCRSAPALSQYHDIDNDADVFGDDVGPYRPQGKSVRSQLANERRSLDPYFHRSNSENTTSCSWNREQQDRLSFDALRKASDRGAPLAPSVLLELLNSGQHLAHSAN